MKKYLLLLLITCVIWFSSQSTQASTDLSAWDIVITTVNTDSTFSTGWCPNPTSTNNAFEFLNRIDIASGTVIYFTDNAITSTGSWRGGEWTIVFTATNLIPAWSFTYYSDCALVSSPANWSKVGGWDPANAWDNLIAYQWVLWGTWATIDFLYAIWFAWATTWITTGIPTSNNSYLPAWLTLWTTALALTPWTKRNAQYTCPSTTNLYEPNFLTTVSDNTNWTWGAVGFSYLTLSWSCSVIPQFDLSVTKTLLPITGNYFSSDYYHIGSPIWFLLQATVLGNTWYNVSLHDILPPYITFVSATATTGNYTNIDGLWQIGKMSSGSTESLIIYGTLQTTGLGYNTGVALYSGVDTNTGNNSAVILYTWLQADNMVLLSWGSQSVISWSTVTYDISYVYSGTFINTWSIAFLFPSGFVLQSSTNPWYLPISWWIIWSWIIFAPNDSWIITLVWTIAGSSGAVFTWTTIIGDDTYCMSHYFLSGNFDGCLETTTWNNISLTTGTILQTVYDLFVIKTWSVTGYAGTIVPYTIIVTNKWPHPATNITVTDIPWIWLIWAPYTTWIVQLLSWQSRVWNTSGAISNSIVSGQNITNTVLVTTTDAGELYTGDNTTWYSFIWLSDKTDIGVTITGVQNIWGWISSYTLIVTNYGPNTWYNLLLPLSKTWPMTLSHTGFVRSSIWIWETVQYTFTWFVSTGVATGTLYSIATIGWFSGVDLMTGNNSTSIAWNISNYAYWFGGGGGYEPAPTGSYTTGIVPVQPIVPTASGDIIYNTDIEDGVCYTRKNLSLITDPYTSIVNKEFPNVLTMLYNYWLTKYTTVDTYRPEDMITRQEAAKMFSQFAMNVLCRKGQDITITYSDIDTVDSTLLPYIDLAYKLWLMHGDTAAGTFRPNDLITKQEFVTVLMRMLLASSLPEPDSDTWYSSYTNLAKNLSILSQNIDQTSVSISRHDAWLLFFRAYKNQDYTLYGIGYILENAQAMIDENQ